MEQLDGNAAGGNLRAIFPFEMTVAEAICDACDTRNAVGALTVYMHGMGTIVRCAACSTALMRVVHARNRYWLDMRGIRVLQIEEEPAQ